MTQTLVPTADVSNSGWTTAPLWSKVDDPNDTTPADYITRANNSTGACRVGPCAALEGRIVDPAVHTSHILKIDCARTGTKSTTIVVSVYQGTTLITSGLSASPTASSYALFSYTLTTTEAGNISNYADLRLDVNCTLSGSSNAPRVSACWLEIPGTAAQDYIDTGLAESPLKASGAEEFTLAPIVYTEIGSNISPLSTAGPDISIFLDGGIAVSAFSTSGADIYTVGGTIYTDTGCSSSALEATGNDLAGFVDAGSTRSVLGVSGLDLCDYIAAGTCMTACQGSGMDWCGFIDGGNTRSEMIASVGDLAAFLEVGSTLSTLVTLGGDIYTPYGGELYIETGTVTIDLQTSCKEILAVVESGQSTLIFSTSTVDLAGFLEEGTILTEFMNSGSDIYSQGRIVVPMNEPHPRLDTIYWQNVQRITYQSDHIKVKIFDKKGGD